MDCCSTHCGGSDDVSELELILYGLYFYHYNLSKTLGICITLLICVRIETPSKTLFFIKILYYDINRMVAKIELGILKRHWRNNVKED